MKTIGNIIWFVTVGLFGAVLWLLAGFIFCVTIIGIPIGSQCFKFASLSLWPFGKEIIPGESTLSILANVLWLVLCGVELAAFYFIIGAFFCITIIGIPFGKQCFKLAELSLCPFGAQIVGI